MTRRGFALLEVLIAMTILASTGLSLVHLVRQAIVNQHQNEAAERMMQEADRTMKALSLLKRGELDQVLGTRDLGEFSVEIEQPERGLYRIAIAERSVGQRELLVAVVHRTVPRGAE